MGRTAYLIDVEYFPPFTLPDLTMSPFLGDRPYQPETFRLHSAIPAKQFPTSPMN